MQWTNIETVLTEELDSKIFDLSAGNIDLAHRIYIKAQCLVIGSNDESITVSLLDKAFSLACGLTSNNLEFIAKKEELRSVPRRSKSTVMSNKAISKPKITVDIQRALHPEFELKLNELKASETIFEMVKKPHVFQQVKHDGFSKECVMAEGLILNDPLLQFS